MRVRLAGEITKIQPQDDGTVIVTGIASSGIPDDDGETITPEAMRLAIPDYMKFGAVREMHQPIAAGSAICMEVQDDGKTRIEALIVDPVTVKKLTCDPPVLKGFSIGGRVPKGGRSKADPKVIERLVLREVSVVDRPAHPEAVIELLKLEEGSAMADEVKKGTYQIGWAADLLTQLDSLQKDTEWEKQFEGDASAIPDKLKAVVSDLAGILRDLVAEETAELVGEGVAMAAKPGDVVKASEPEPTPEPAPAEPATDPAPEPEADPVEKGGKRFSAATKDALKKAHDMIREADKCMKAVGYDAEDEGEEGAEETDETKETSKKASGLTVSALEDPAEHLTKIAALTEETEQLKKALADANAKLATKGSLKVVPIEKAADTGSPIPEEPEPVTALDAIKKAHRAGGRLVLVNSPRA